ncbi:MAG: NAD(P)/FAD-dependent oxidoreductase [Gammaproteobacteria bacterium]|nr:NAD(P)/FAD-dependent oxidoreductase [Gammaproteobacteria bacterium]
MLERTGDAGAASAADCDVLVVGAGFAGLYMLHELRGMGFRVRVLEAGSGIGGTWFWNRYPGARCDVESMEYSYQFSPELQQEWAWSERYATQPEILRYIEHVAARFDLMRDIDLDTPVRAAHFDEAAALWRLETATGRQLSARFCVMATGCLSSPNTPQIAGLDSFAGARYHTGHWPHEGVDFSGQRVGVIGTGSSAIQSIPIIAGQASGLVVFQRSPSYSIPAHNAPLDPARVSAIKADYAAFRRRNREMTFGVDFRARSESALAATPEAREREYEARWADGGLAFLGAYGDLLLDEDANRTAAEFIRAKIRATVRDPAVAERLLPRQTVGCKRLCVDTDYFATFNRPNVTLVDLRETPIEAVTPAGVRTTARDHVLDSLVLATGFDAMTGALSKIDVRGRGGLTLAAKWADGPRTYLGLQIAGFPNLFTVTGPGSPSVLTNMLPSIEQHVAWIAACIGHLRERALRTIEAAPAAEAAWVEHVNAVAGGTLYPHCSSWYLGANVPGKPRVFMPYIGFPPYVAKCEEVVARGYEGFVLAA